MKNLDLNAMGVEEMNVNEEVMINGGGLWDDFVDLLRDIDDALEGDSSGAGGW